MRWPTKLQKRALAIAFSGIAYLLCFLLLKGPLKSTRDEKLDALEQMFDISTTSPVHLNLRTKAGGCRMRASLPDPECTPGMVFAEKTREDICKEGYTKTVRNVPASLKKKIYAAYDIAYPQPTGTYEADHLISLELGGSNDRANLFPEAADPPPGFKEKDIVENYLHIEMCAGRASLGEVQGLIATDWVKVYESLSPEEIDALKRQFKSWAK